MRTKPEISLQGSWAGRDFVSRGLSSTSDAGIGNGIVLASASETEFGNERNLKNKRQE
jgi:hypothetical protein